MITVRRYHKDGAEEPTDPAAVSDFLGQPDCLLWVDVEDPDPSEVALLVEEFGVHRLAAADLMERTGRARLVRYPHHSLLALRDPVTDGAGRLTARSIDIAFGDGWLVTVRKRSADGQPPTDPEPFRRRFDRERKGDGVTDEGFLLYVITDEVIDHCFDAGEALDDRLEAVEAVIFSDGRPPTTVTEDLYRLRQDLVSLRRMVSPLREALGPLLRRELDFIGDTALVHLHDSYDLAVRLTETTDATRDLLGGALEAHLALASNRINDVMKKATSWGAILVSGSLVAGIYGMNFDNVPWNGQTEGFVYALVVILVVSAGLYAGFKRRDWL